MSPLAMTPEARNRTYALLIVGEAVVILILATLLLRGFDEPELSQYEPVPAMGSGSGAGMPLGDQALRAADAAGQACTVERSEQPVYDSAPERIPVVAQERYAPEDPLGLVLYGVVFDPEGRPVEEANIRLTSLESGRGLDATFYKDSGYAVTGLQPGPWRISVTTTGHHPIRRTIQLAPSPARRRLDLYVRSATTVDVAVRTPEGRPLRAELRSNGLKRVYTVVQAFSKDPRTSRGGIPGLDNSHNDRSCWSWEKRRPEADGLLEVLIEPPCFVALLVGEAVLDCKPYTGAEDLVTVTASLDKVKGALASVLVHVAASDGSALEKVGVYADNAYSRKPTVAGGNTYRLEHVRPGVHRLIVTAKGRGNFYRWVRLRSGKELEVDVVLDVECKVEGQVLGPDGPLRGVSVRLYPLDPKVPANLRFRAGTGEGGEFQIHRVSPGDYELVVHHRGKQLYGTSRISVQPGASVLPPITMGEAGKLMVEASGLASGVWYLVRIKDRRGRLLFRSSFDLYGITLLLPHGRHCYEIVDRKERLVRTGDVVIGAEPAVLTVQ